MDGNLHGSQAYAKLVPERESLVNSKNGSQYQYSLGTVTVSGRQPRAVWTSKSSFQMTMPAG